MGSLKDKYEKRRRNAFSYQMWLRLLELMRAGKYFEVLAEIQKGRESGGCGSFKYRKHIGYSIESIAQLKADYDQFGDETFERFKVRRERLYNESFTGVNDGGYMVKRRFVRGIDDECDDRFRIGVYQDLNEVMGWRDVVLVKGKNWGFEERIKHGRTKDKPAWLERNLAEKPPYNGHGGGIRRTEKSDEAGGVRKRAGARIQANSHAKGVDGHARKQHRDG